MNRSVLIGAVLLIVISVMIWRGNRSPQSMLKGERNTTLTFQGMAVDQDGKPLPGVHVEYKVEAFPKDWTFETRGNGSETKTVAATSDAEGRLRFTVTGYIMRRTKAEKTGYRHFYDEDNSDNSPSTYGYQLIAWGVPWYSPSPYNPAVYVFVEDGLTEVSALPCKGGSSSGGSTSWFKNEPAWPRKPSLKDVVQRQSTSTQPTSNPSP